MQMYLFFSKGLNSFVDISIESVIDNVYTCTCRYREFWQALALLNSSQMSGESHFSLDDLKADINS